MEIRQTIDELPSDKPINTIIHNFIQLDKDAELNYQHIDVINILDEILCECKKKIQSANQNPENVFCLINDTLKDMGFIYKYQPSDEAHDNCHQRVNFLPFSTV